MKKNRKLIALSTLALAATGLVGCVTVDAPVASGYGQHYTTGSTVTEGSTPDGVAAVKPARLWVELSADEREFWRTQAEGAGHEFLIYGGEVVWLDMAAAQRYGDKANWLDMAVEFYANTGTPVVRAQLGGEEPHVVVAGIDSAGQMSEQKVDYSEDWTSSLTQ